MRKMQLLIPEAALCSCKEREGGKKKSVLAFTLPRGSVGHCDQWSKQGSPAAQASHPWEGMS